MHRILGYRCTLCGKEFPFEPERMTCPDCGEKGILDIIYDYSEIKKINFTFQISYYYKI